MKINFKKTHPNAKTPEYAHESDACMDLYAADVKHSFDQDYVEYDTGVALELPQDHVALVFPRSSVSKTPHWLRNSTAVIDSNFRGSIKLRFGPYVPPKTKLNGVYQVGDRIGQLMIIPRPKIELEEVEELEDTDRGEGGLGSTGR